MSHLLTLLLLAPRPILVDVHVHTTPARTALVADLLAANGITRFVNLSGGSPGDGLEEALEAAAPLEGRVAVCANPEWRHVGDADFGEREAAMLAQASTLGARCLKISKALGLMVPDPAHPDILLPVDDARLDPMWAAAGALGFPVFIHVGDPKAFFEPLGPNNERMAELGVHPEWSFADPKYPRQAVLLAQLEHVMARHRETKFIAVHFGNNAEDLTYVDRLLTENPNAYVDIAARIPEIGRHDPAQVRALFIRHQDRILFGTDLGVTRGIMLGSVGSTRPGLPDIFLFYADHFRWFESARKGMPHPTPIQGDWTIDGIDLPRDVLTKVYGTNALQLLFGVPGPTAVDRAALAEAPEMTEYF